jgi:phosphoesterase RecJ-like protein
MIPNPPPACREVARVLKSGSRFLMLPHIHIDGDDLGSMVGLAAALDRLGKESYLYSPDLVPEVFRWLPGSERIQNRMPQGPFDAVILMECPAEGRLPPGIRPRELGRVVINFDHHPGNTMPADVHWVEPGRAALGEMAVLLVDSLGVPLDREIATALYVALVTDSGNFQYSQVSAQTHRIAARLVEQIGDVSEICRRLFRDRPVAEMVLTGKVLQTLRTSADGQVAWADLDSEMLRATGARPDDAQNLVADVNRVRGTRVFALFKNLNPGQVRVSLRSTGPEVNQVAALFGGGGHRLAASLTVENIGLEKARHQVLEALQRQMAESAPPEEF